MKRLQQIRKMVDLIRSWPAVLLLRMLGAYVGKNCIIHGVSFRARPVRLAISDDVLICPGSILCVPLKSNGTIRIGRRTGMGRVEIFAMNLVVIGEGCLLSNGIHISDSEHITGPGIEPISSGLQHRAAVRVGHRCFVGRNVTLLPGTELGDDCVVGAGAVVTGTWPDCSVIGGVPAKLIKTNEPKR